MTHTKQFIEDAIKGRWEVEHDKFLLHEALKEIEFCTYFKAGELDYHGEKTEVGQFKKSERISLGLLLLDTQAWQAVGKTRGWDEMQMLHYGDRFTHKKRSEVEHYWHNFIDHLADGKSIEDALAAITD